MRKDLLRIYNNELAYLRQMGGEFARKHPRVASGLALDQTGSQDPHVERLIESFALLASRVHLRLDDDFPRLSESLLKIVFPGYLRPIPSMTIVECVPDASQGKKSELSTIPAGASLLSRSRIDGKPLRFRTSYPVDLWPFAVAAAEWRLPERLATPARASGNRQAAAVARVLLRCAPDATFANLPLQTLRFHLSGDANITFNAYELMASNCVEIQLRDPRKPSHIVRLDADSIRMVGLEPEENILPTVRRALDGYRLLTEYFAFPEKFLFFDLQGLEALTNGDFEKEVEILFLFSRFERAERQGLLEVGVSRETFRLGCTPAVNLFEQMAEPILVDQARSEYTIIPDAKHPELAEVFSVEEVTATVPRLRQSVTVEPMYAYRYALSAQEGTVYWNATRELHDVEDDAPSIMKIALVDGDGTLSSPAADVLLVRTLCSNFRAAQSMPIGMREGDFDIVGHSLKSVTALSKPTPSVAPPMANGQLWRLVSALSLNYLSLESDGCAALQELLRLHNFGGDSAMVEQTASISELSSSPHFALVESPYGLSPARGTHVQMQLDENRFSGGGAYLFTAVLDRFLAGYTSINSFSQLTALSSMRKEAIARWPPRAGSQALM